MVDKIEIKFTKVKIPEYNRFEKNYEVIIDYFTNDKERKFSRVYSIDLKSEEIIVNVVNSIKDLLREECKENSCEEDFLSGHSVIAVKNLEGFERKFLIFIKRFKDKVNEVINNKQAEGYMNRLFLLKNYEQIL